MGLRKSIKPAANTRQAIIAKHRNSPVVFLHEKTFIFTERTQFAFIWQRRLARERYATFKSTMIKELYIFKVWITTIVFSPIILILSWSLFWWEKLDFIGSIQLFGLMLLFGSLFSIPTTIILGYLFKVLSYKKVNQILLIGLLCGYCTIAIFITFYLVDKAFVSNKIDQLMFPISYSVAMSLSLLLYKIKANVA